MNKRDKNKKIVRPIDAGSLVIYQKKGDQIQVLMGRRGNKAKFQPGYYVFPGGVKERSDYSSRFLNKISKNSIRHMGVSNSQSKANALAMTAIREAYEEVGLVFGKRVSGNNNVLKKKWHYFEKNNIWPDLESLEYLGRAITPSYLPIRYHARFFSVPYDRLLCAEKIDGELEDIKWIDLDNLATVKMMDVQKMILDILRNKLNSGTLVPKFLFFKWGKKNIV